MSLGSGEWLLGGSTDDTYCAVLTIHILAAFRRVTVTVGNNDRGILDVRGSGVGFRGVMVSGRRGGIRGCCECLLGAGG